MRYDMLKANVTESSVWHRMYQRIITPDITRVAFRSFLQEVSIIHLLPPNAHLSFLHTAHNARVKIESQERRIRDLSSGN
jgi:hypothetical protein